MPNSLIEEVTGRAQPTRRAKMAALTQHGQVRPAPINSNSGNPMDNISPRWNWLHTQQEERRVLPRASEPWMRIETQGFSYIALDWSAGGVAIDRFHDAGTPGTLVSGQAGWASADSLFTFTGDIVRKTSHGVTVLRWLDLPADFLTQLDVGARLR